MAYEFLGQILAGIIISGMLLAGPLAVVFYGWSEWHGKIHQGELPVWKRIAASVGILFITAQTILFITLLATIFSHKVAAPYRFFLSECVLSELALLVVAAPCAFAWRGRFRWWLLASSVYLPVISFFSALAALAY
jgi:hypothetical protein